MRRYDIDYSDTVQSNTRVVHARNPAGAMRAFTKNWTDDGPNPWTFTITIREGVPRQNLFAYLREMLSLEAVRDRLRSQRT
jgi:hypothetical protein